MVERQQADPTVSVVIVTYNRADYVQTCLEHLDGQTRAPLEIIVVDSSPNDDTRDLLAAWPGVVYLRNEAGLGTMATSRAIGTRRAEGDIVAFIDDDAFAEPEWLENLVRPYADPRVGAVGGRSRNEQPGEESVGLDQIGQFLEDGTLTGYFAADPGHDLEVDHLQGCNMSFRRSALEAIGGIHDHYPGTCLREESDISLRIRAAGHRIIYTPTAVVLHIGGVYAKGRRFDLRYFYYASRNHVVLLSHVFGRRSPYLRRYLGTAARSWGRELAQAGGALFDSERRGLKSKVRGAGGGLSRAGVGVAGTISGAVAAARLTPGCGRAGHGV